MKESVDNKGDSTRTINDVIVEMCGVEEGASSLYSKSKECLMSHQENDTTRSTRSDECAHIMLTYDSAAGIEGD